MAELVRWSLPILHTLVMAGIKVDHFNRMPDADKRVLLNANQNHMIDREVSTLKDRGYYLVGCFNSIPLDVRQEIQNTPNVKCQILNHYCWVSLYNEPLRSDVVLVDDSDLAVYLRLIAADVPQFLGVHKK